MDDHQDHQGELVVVTGMTGAGRSTAAKELEDLGFFVVDNLPPELVGEMVRLIDDKQGVDQPIAAVVDVRAGVFFESLREQLATEFPTRRTTLLFLEASDDILVRRQEAARRPHPLQGAGRLLDGLQRERRVLADLRSDADLVIDTSNLSSDANKVALATRSDSVLLARTAADDATALRRLAGLLRSKNVDIALTALFPPRAELLTLYR